MKSCANGFDTQQAYDTELTRNAVPHRRLNPRLALEVQVKWVVFADFDTERSATTSRSRL